MKNGEMTRGGALLTVMLCLLFGGNGVAMKLSYTGIGPFTTAGFRFALASGILVAWSLYRKIPLNLTPRQWRLIMVQCVLFCCQVCGFHLGLAHTTASHAAIIANVLPFVVLILAHFFIPGDRITPKKGLGILMGFVGVVVLFFDRPDLGTGIYKGDIIVLGAVLCWSVSAIYIKRVNDHFHAVQITLVPMIFSLPVFLINGWLWDDVMVTGITPVVVKAVFYQGAITAAFGFVAWNTLLKRFGASVLHSFVFIIPIAGVTFGVLFLGEPLTSYLLAAVAFVVAGIVVVNLRPRKREPVLPPH